MSDMTVIDRGNHCEIHQGDAIAADYVASKRLATLFAAAPEMLAALKVWLELETTCDGRRPCYCEDPEIAKHGKCYACMAVNAIAKAEGRGDA